MNWEMWKYMNGKKQRYRRSMQDMREIMEPYKNVFRDWAYAGDKATMRELFPEDITYWQYVESQGPEEYFSEIPDVLFKDAEIIKRFGENLRTCRGEKGWTLKEAANVLGIDFQQLQQIEAGERKGIHKNLLLLFCGVYRISPEELMGLSSTTEKEATQAIVFYPETNSKKAKYVVDRLIYQDGNLLDIFCYLSKLPPSIRNTLTVFLKNTPVIKVYNPKQITEIAQTGYERQIPVNNDGELLANPRWSQYCEDLCKASLDTPDLLDVYVSVAAADKSTWDVLLYLLSFSGFLPFATMQEENITSAE